MTWARLMVELLSGGSDAMWCMDVLLPVHNVFTQADAERVKRLAAARANEQTLVNATRAARKAGLKRSRSCSQRRAQTSC